MNMNRVKAFAGSALVLISAVLCSCGAKNTERKRPGTDSGLAVFTDAPTTAPQQTVPQVDNDYDQTKDDYYYNDESDYYQQETTAVTTKKNKKNNSSSTTAAASKNKKNKKNKNTTTAAEEYESAETYTEAWTEFDDKNYVEYHFRNQKLLNQHFEKHGGEFRKDFGYQNAEEYEKGASDVINNPEALHKTEAEDGDGVYYIEATNEFVILSTDGYIRTYFRPNGGLDYYNRQ